MNCDMQFATTSNSSGSVLTVDTTAAQIFQISDFNNATQAGTYAYMVHLILEKLTP